MDSPTAPPVPSHLSASSRRLWGEVLNTYDLEPHELETLRLALENLDRSATARRKLKDLGLTYEDRFGQPHARPEVAIARDCTATYARLMGVLKLPVEGEESAAPRGATTGRFTPRGQGRVARAKRAPGVA